MQLGGGHGAIVLALGPILNFMYVSGSKLGGVSRVRYERIVEQLVDDHMNGSRTSIGSRVELGGFPGSKLKDVGALHTVRGLGTRSFPQIL